MSLDDTHARSTSEQFDFFSDDFQQRPHEHYAEVRARCPVAHNGQPYDWYALTHEADVKEVLRNYKLWTSDQGPGLAYTRGGVLVSVDPPQHTSDRRLVSKAFAPADLLAMEPDIRQLIGDEIDKFVGRGEGDLMELLAIPVPLIVIAWLLGLDPDFCRTIRPAPTPWCHRPRDRRHRRRHARPRSPTSCRTSASGAS